jgi:hypothetical protein
MEWWMHVSKWYTIWWCLWKVFRPLDFFHILLGHSLIPKCIKSFFPLIHLHTIPFFFAYLLKRKKKILHLHKFSDPLLSILLKHLWQCLQPWVFLSMTLPAWHTCIWGVSHSLLYRFSQVLSGWMRSVAAQLFSGPSIDVRSGSSLGCCWGTQRNSETCPPKPLLHCLGCVLKAVVQLEGEPSPLHIDFLRSSLPRSWRVSQSLPLKNFSTAWCCLHCASHLSHFTFK